MPDSCKVFQPKNGIASYKSGTVRELGDLIRGKHNPGIGEYDLTGFNAIGKTTFEGGGAPNNFTLCYKDLNPTIRKVEAKISPRIAPAVSNSKSNLISFGQVSIVSIYCSSSSIGTRSVYS